MFFDVTNCSIDSLKAYSYYSDALHLHTLFLAYELQNLTLPYCRLNWLIFNFYDRKKFTSQHLHMIYILETNSFRIFVLNLPMEYFSRYKIDNLV